MEAREERGLESVELGPHARSVLSCYDFTSLDHLGTTRIIPVFPFIEDYGGKRGLESVELSPHAHSVLCLSLIHI